jgi:3-hydroxybutyryl-CoA dehydrogenase
MGHGIAQVSAQGGYDVVLLDADAAALEKGLASVEKLLARAVEKGKLDAQDAAATRARITGTTEHAGLADCDLVIEAIVERIEPKVALWGQLDAVVKPEAIFATNTSSLSVVEQAAASGRPDRFIGLHFFNPAQVMQLVEVIRAITSSDEAVALGTQYVERIGKTPVQTKDRAGFIVNRLLIPFLVDAVRGYEEGIGSIADIDAALRLGAGHPMGPLTLADFVGLDTLFGAAEGMFAEFRDPRLAPPSLLHKMRSAGWYGKKSGLGFYDWTGEKPVPNPGIDALRRV